MICLNFRYAYSENLFYFCTFLFKNYPPPTWDDVFACAVVCFDINPARNFRFYAKLTELRNRIRNNTTAASSGMTTTVPVRSQSTSKPLSNTISLTSSNNNNESQLSSGSVLSSVAEVSHDSLSPNEDSSLSSIASSNSSDASWSASR